jgi:hypothetical protein
MNAYEMLLLVAVIAVIAALLLCVYVIVMITGLIYKEAKQRLKGKQ